MPSSAAGSLYAETKYPANAPSATTSMTPAVITHRAVTDPGSTANRAPMATATRMQNTTPRARRSNPPGSDSTGVNHFARCRIHNCEELYGSPEPLAPQDSPYH